MQKHYDVELYPFFLQLLEHHAVYLEDLFELSNNFDAQLIQETSRMFWKFQGFFFFYFYYASDPAKFRNHGLRTREKRDVTVFSNKPLSRPFRDNVRIHTIIFLC